MPEARTKTEGKKKTGLIVVFAAVAILATGYVCLGMGSVTIAPVLIIGSFVMMAVGIGIGWD